MFKDHVLGGLNWLPLISRIVWAKNPRDPRDVAPLKNEDRSNNSANYDSEYPVKGTFDDSEETSLVMPKEDQNFGSVRTGNTSEPVSLYI